MFSLSDPLNCPLLALCLFLFLLLFHQPQPFAMRLSPFLFLAPLFHRSGRSPSAKWYVLVAPLFLRTQLASASASAPTRVEYAWYSQIGAATDPPIQSNSRSAITRAFVNQSRASVSMSDATISHARAGPNRLIQFIFCKSGTAASSSPIVGSSSCLIDASRLSVLVRAVVCPMTYTLGGLLTEGHDHFAFSGYALQPAGNC
jgi:hypothetical protein